MTAHFLLIFSNTRSSDALAAGHLVLQALLFISAYRSHSRICRLPTAGKGDKQAVKSVLPAINGPSVCQCQTIHGHSKIHISSIEDASDLKIQGQ